jgi:hypothetical protein
MVYNYFDMPKLLTHHLTEKELSEDIAKPGDYCLRVSVPVRGKDGNDDKKIKKAIILKCPYCAMDMMSIEAHKIFFKRTIWQELLFLPGSGKLNVIPFLQCPYNPSHKFLIKNGKIKKA